MTNRKIGRNRGRGTEKEIGNDNIKKISKLKTIKCNNNILEIQSLEVSWLLTRNNTNYIYLEEQIIKMNVIDSFWYLI